MRRFAALGLLFGLLPGLAFASEPFQPGCPDAQVFSTKLLTDICWSCVFPIRIAGIELGGGSRPAGAADQTFCVCPDPLGLPEPGIAMGFWAPARLIEVVRMPYCSPSLGGVFLRRFTRLLGHRGDGAGTTSGAYYHYHYFAFPLLVMLDLFLNDHCHSDGYYVDFDLLYLSELDPTWNSDELAFFVNPESALFANPPALAACLVDAGLATAGQPQDSLFWCAGTWGNLYPLTGRIPWGGTPPRDAALIATRATAARRPRDGRAAPPRAGLADNGQRRALPRTYPAGAAEESVPAAAVLPGGRSQRQSLDRGKRLPLGRLAQYSSDQGGFRAGVVDLEGLLPAVMETASHA